MLDQDDERKDITEVIRERQANIIVETAKNVEADHLKLMDGVNRNLNT